MATVAPAGGTTTVYITVPDGVPAAPQPTWDAAQQRLAAVKKVQFKQGRAILEAATGGAMPNRYVLSDREFMYQPTRNNDPYGDPEGWPMFVVEERADGCCCTKDCLCRVCCSPMHPSLSDLYVSSGPIEGMSCCCGMCHTADYVVPEGPPVMSYERVGLCTRLPNCFVCCEMCQDEMRFHTGLPADPKMASQAGSLNTASCIAVGKVPIGGGGCTPTVELFQTAGGVDVSNATPAAVLTGPTCFGGLYDWCCDTKFQFSTNDAPGSANLATITKRKPRNCSECCRAMCTTADIYDLDMTEGAEVAPLQKALMIGEIVHLDFMFFERDQFPITCEKRDEATYITILCCLCYCYGCLCPCKVVLAIPEKK